MPDPSLLPALPGMLPVRGPILLGQGWDNEMWHVGDLPDGTRVVLRRPHRELGRWALQQEIRALEGMGAHTAFRAPRLLAVLPPEHPLGPAALVTWLEGRVVADLPRSGRARAGDLLARALAQLHRPAPADHPRSPYRGVPLAERAAATGEDLAVLRAAGAPGTAAVRDALERGLDAAPWTGPDLLLHGDPHPANLLVLPDGALGLLDWGDTTAGDPASDLGQLFVLDPGGAAFAACLRSSAAAGHLGDEAALRALDLRARAWAARFAAAVLAHDLAGRDGAQAPLTRCALALLRAWS